MTKRELKILEEVFESEINSALSKTPFSLYQTKSKLAKKLVDEGYLRESIIILKGHPPIKIKGYELTIRGHFTYSNSCKKGE